MGDFLCKYAINLKGSNEYEMCQAFTIMGAKVEQKESIWSLSKETA